MKVSFDFDSTLDKPAVQSFCAELISKGVEVWICTSRWDDSKAVENLWGSDYNDDLYLVADRLGIAREKIIFTNHKNKIDFLKDKSFAFHLDDDVRGCGSIGISCWCNTSWKNKCLKILNK